MLYIGTPQIVYTFNWISFLYGTLFWIGLKVLTSLDMRRMIKESRSRSTVISSLITDVRLLVLT